MIKSLKHLFSGDSTKAKEENNEDLKILCGLMIEAANTDGKISNEEINKISATLTNVFNKNSIDVEQILNETITTKITIFFYFKNK